jgi:hypothetical protein
VFIFIVFVGGWMDLIPAHLPHLRVLGLQGCEGVFDEHIQQLTAAVPELVVLINETDTVGGRGNKELEQKLGPDFDCDPDKAYDVIMKWAWDG